MSLFQWFSRAFRPVVGPDSAAGRRGTREQDSRTAQTPRGQRSERREKLYGLVREAMVRSGVLSAGYKFKVLALDAQGQRFVVMIDLAPAYAADAIQQRNIETLMAELARTRLNVGVHAVYWRVNGQMYAAPAQPAAQRPAAADWAGGRAGQPHPAGAVAVHTGFEPIDALEMDAFRQAVATSAAHPSKSGGRGGRGSRLGPGSGAEEGAEFAVSGMGSLGVTQYGELR